MLLHRGERNRPAVHEAQNIIIGATYTATGGSKVVVTASPA
jgi:hypothetical protein